jgi:ubiquinone/menaquinone biosynthesis C-methylase UbiE
MGRFESTAAFYDLYREPYPSQFFAEVARRLRFQGTERLLDVACGPAPLAIGFAPFVGSCAGVDPEPEMIAAARYAASQADVDLELIASRFEDLSVPPGAFAIVTIGRALHWLDREIAPGLLGRMLAPGGHVLICSSITAEGPVNPWASTYRATRKSWSPGTDERRYHVDVDEWFRHSPVRKVEEISVNYCHRVTVESLIGRALSMSTTSPQALGERRDAFETALREALQAFAEDGTLSEEIRTKALVFHRE